MSARRSHAGDYHADFGIMGKFRTRTRILLQTIDAKNAFQEVDVAPDWAAAFIYYLDDLNICTLPFTVRVMRDVSERNPATLRDDDVTIGGYGGDSRKSDEPRGRLRIDREVRGAVASRVPDAEGAKRMEESPT